ncbi:hypothetical protein TPHV1_20068 [Treponema phagedenis]|uniref:Uncharacterized protein n=1 Tax=Treponema phagedenis TaxID=162 RepID=A0A0B7GY38_TREPH|nr:hypothetical protein TPHV1_20068 [Treponema phagedenis]
MKIAAVRCGAIQRCARIAAGFLLPCVVRDAIIREMPMNLGKGALLVAMPSRKKKNFKSLNIVRAREGKKVRILFLFGFIF